MSAKKRVVKKRASHPHMPEGGTIALKEGQLVFLITPSKRSMVLSTEQIKSLISKGKITLSQELGGVVAKAAKGHEKEIEKMVKGYAARRK